MNPGVTRLITRSLSQNLRKCRMVRQIFTVAMLAFASANSALAGGPKYVAGFSPSTGSYSGPLEVVVQISAGTVATLQEVMEAYPGSSGMNSSPPVTGTGERFVSPLTPPVIVPRIEFR